MGFSWTAHRTKESHGPPKYSHTSIMGRRWEIRGRHEGTVVKLIGLLFQTKRVTDIRKCLILIRMGCADRILCRLDHVKSFLWAGAGSLCIVLHWKLPKRSGG